MALLSDVAFSTPGRRWWPEEPHDLATLSAIAWHCHLCLIETSILTVNKCKVFWLEVRCVFHMCVCELLLSVMGLKTTHQCGET